MVKEGITVDVDFHELGSKKAGFVPYHSVCRLRVASVLQHLLTPVYKKMDLAHRSTFCASSGAVYRFQARETIL